jgi:hypothetical protein
MAALAVVTIAVAAPVVYAERAFPLAKRPSDLVRWMWASASLVTDVSVPAGH